MITNNSKYENYFLISFLENRFGDPITCMCINENCLLLGTMLGRIILFSIKKRITSIIAETSNENISGISFDSQTSFLVAVGDEEVTSYKMDSLLSIPSVIHFKNYQNESEHIKYCDLNYVILHQSVLFKIMLQQPEEENIEIAKVKNYYEIKNLKTKSIRIGEIDMTNYVVPFDFDEEKFLWVEFLSDSEKNICTYTFPTDYSGSSILWKYPLNKSFGHISQAKLINGGRIFIVRNVKVCEIRKCDSNFTLLYSCQNIGDFVLAVEIFYKSQILLDKNTKIPAKNSNPIYKASTKQNPNKEDLESQNDSIHNNNHDEAFNIDDETSDLQIILLDIEGNINIIKDGEISTITNIYKVEGIKKEYLEKRLFSLGYQYIIRIYDSMIAIACDFGCLLISSKMSLE